MSKMKCGECKYGVKEQEGVIYCTHIETIFKRTNPQSFCNYWQEKEGTKDDKIHNRANG